MRNWEVVDGVRRCLVCGNVDPGKWVSRPKRSILIWRCSVCRCHRENAARQQLHGEAREAFWRSKAERQAMTAPIRQRQAYAGYQGYGRQNQRWEDERPIKAFEAFRQEEAKAAQPFDETEHWWNHPENIFASDDPMVKKTLRSRYAMIRRCYDKRDHAYPDYGGRGILVCKRWYRSSWAFIHDLGLPPSKFHSIDRIDNDRSYVPGNVQWATKQRQQRNKRCTIMVDWNGRRMPLADVCDELELSHWQTWIIRKRVAYYGWTLEEALSVPIKPRVTRGRKTGYLKLYPQYAKSL